MMVISWTGGVVVWEIVWSSTADGSTHLGLARKFFLGILGGTTLLLRGINSPARPGKTDWWYVGGTMNLCQGNPLNWVRFWDLRPRNPSNSWS